MDVDREAEPRGVAQRATVTGIWDDYRDVLKRDGSDDIMCFDQVALISYFLVNWPFRGQGVGDTWYKKLEQIFQSTGFKSVGIRG